MSAFENCDCPTCQANRAGPQPEFLWRPLPWWRRYNRWDWLLVTGCIFGATLAIAGIVTGIDIWWGAGHDLWVIPVALALLWLMWRKL